MKILATGVNRDGGAASPILSNLVLTSRGTTDPAGAPDRRLGYGRFGSQFGLARTERSRVTLVILPDDVAAQNDAERSYLR